MPPKAKKVVEEEYDPFAPGQDDVPDGDEAQTETPPWEVTNETFDTETDDDKNVKAVSTMSEGKVVVTLKGGRDYDDAWVVIHANDLDDAVAQVTDYEKLGTLLDATQKASKRFRELRPSDPTRETPKTSQGGSQARTQGKPAQATAHPKGRQEFCQHGEMEFKTGLGKNEKLWGAFDCKVDPKGCPRGRVWDNDFGK
jgi:hypothetical protein